MEEIRWQRWNDPAKASLATASRCMLRWAPRFAHNMASTRVGATSSTTKPWWREQSRKRALTDFIVCNRKAPHAKPRAIPAETAAHSAPSMTDDMPESHSDGSSVSRRSSSLRPWASVCTLSATGSRVGAHQKDQPSLCCGSPRSTPASFARIWFPLLETQSVSGRSNRLDIAGSFHEAEGLWLTTSSSAARAEATRAHPASSAVATSQATNAVSVVASPPNRGCPRSACQNSSATSPA